MTVATILSGLDPLSTTDTVGEALVDMAEAHVAHLPVLDPTGRLDSIVTEAALRAHPDPDAPLGTLMAGEPVAIAADTHVFDAAHLLRQHGLSVLPVVAEGNAYTGLVVRQDVFGQLAHMLATEEPGAIVVLDVSRDNFSLGQVAQIIEQSGVRILSVSTEDDLEERAAAFLRYLDV